MACALGASCVSSICLTALARWIFCVLSWPSSTCLTSVTDLPAATAVTVQAVMSLLVVLAKNSAPGIPQGLMLKPIPPNTSGCGRYAAAWSRMQQLVGSASERRRVVDWLLCCPTSSCVGLRLYRGLPFPSASTPASHAACSASSSRT